MCYLCGCEYGRRRPINTITRNLKFFFDGIYPNNRKNRLPSKKYIVLVDENVFFLIFKTLVV